MKSKSSLEINPIIDPSNKKLTKYHLQPILKTVKLSEVNPITDQVQGGLDEWRWQGRDEELEAMRLHKE